MSSSTNPQGDFFHTATENRINASKNSKEEFGLLTRIENCSSLRPQQSNGPSEVSPSAIGCDSPSVVQKALMKMLGSSETQLPTQDSQDLKRVESETEREGTPQKTSFSTATKTKPENINMDQEAAEHVHESTSGHPETVSCRSVSSTSKVVSIDMQAGPSATPTVLTVHSSSSADILMASPESSDSSMGIMQSDMNIQRRTPKRTQVCITRTISLNLEIPFKKATESLIMNRDTGTSTQSEAEMRTLSRAIYRKYLDPLKQPSNEDDTGSITVVIVATPRTPSLPPTLVLNDCDISSIGNLHDIQSMCHVVRELDLAQNKINDLCEVQKILHSMQRLTFLNLSSNDLSKKDIFPMEITPVKTMKWLVLNSTHIAWDGVENLLHVMPNLEELYLSLNGYCTVDLDKSKMASIHLVHISGNPLSDWADVEHLGHKFPNLDTLVMADCYISTLTNEDKIGQTFEKLQSLNISNNRICTWEEIDKLLQFPALIDLRLLGQPLLERYSEQQRRQLMIGRLPNLERLNGSRISDQEREDAERAFIRYYMEKHPEERPRRYHQLVKKHGKLDPLVNVDLRPKTVVQVLILYEQKREIRAVNVLQTVASLKASFQEFTGLIPSQMRVFYLDKEMEEFQGPEELRLNSKMLYRYNMQDGDEFHIYKK